MSLFLSLFMGTVPCEMRFFATIEAASLSGFTDQFSKLASQFTISFFNTVYCFVTFFTTVVTHSSPRLSSFLLILFRLRLLIRTLVCKMAILLASVAGNTLLFNKISLYFLNSLSPMFLFRLWTSLSLPIPISFVLGFGWTIVLKVAFLTTQTAGCQRFIKLTKHSQRRIALDKVDL